MAREKSSENAVQNGEKRTLLIFPRIICLLLAFLIWIYVINITSDNYEKTFTLIDISVDGSDKLLKEYNMSIYDISESKVNITVTGSRKDINKLSSSDFSAYIDVGDIKTSGRHNTNVKVSVPSSVSTVSYSPNTVAVSTDIRESKEFDILCNVENYSIQNNVFKIGEITPQKNKITVSGPASVLSKVANVSAMINFGGAALTSSRTFNAPLSVVDETGNEIENQFISMSDTSLNVNIQIIEKKAFSLGVDTSAADKTKKYTVTVLPSMLTVEGESSLIAAMGKINIYTLSGSEDVDVKIPISSVVLPEGVTLADTVSATEITVKIVFEKEEQTTEAPATTESPLTTESPDMTNSPEETSKPS